MPLQVSKAIIKVPYFMRNHHKPPHSFVLPLTHCGLYGLCMVKAETFFNLRNDFLLLTIIKVTSTSSL